MDGQPVNPLYHTDPLYTQFTCVLVLGNENDGGNYEIVSICRCCFVVINTTVMIVPGNYSRRF